MMVPVMVLEESKWFVLHIMVLTGRSLYITLKKLSL